MGRLDQRLIEDKLLPSRESASEEIKKGLVRVNGQVILKPGYKLKPEDDVSYHGKGRHFVSRGAQKLIGAQQAFQLDFNGKRCLDVGASTGGFSQVMLEGGAKEVVALDVGHGQLDPSLKKWPNLKEKSGCNFRNLGLQDLAELGPFDFVTMDVSFISVTLLLENLKKCIKTGAFFMILIKPQFEAGPSALNKQGVVKKRNDHEKVLQKVLTAFQDQGLTILDVVPSPIQGPKGNWEYLSYGTLAEDPKPLGNEELKALIQRTLNLYQKCLELKDDKDLKDSKEGS